MAQTDYSGMSCSIYVIEKESKTSTTEHLSPVVVLFELFFQKDGMKLNMISVINVNLTGKII